MQAVRPSLVNPGVLQIEDQLLDSQERAVRLRVLVLGCQPRGPQLGTGGRGRARGGAHL